MHPKAECALHASCACYLSCVAVVRSETQYISTLSMQKLEGMSGDADAASAKPEGTGALLA